ncbi:hypothetical protein [Desulfuromonas acetoxidans]|uniref:Uncharacterized protein n=1 Tax=Desulfuromonas acetoxidans (strain DSM 684 / 11070) TaxID=281689 RepID=Q1JW95_DESA6|nr:hypothetical protein [Desulfuromonas acetoxidans]EAT14526.1 hypothetical protein Dace_0387 [Desulfuromonas acetoxidans DSM 684]MBF0645257.1 hypothetical protein [Desulfuromonas acetoxidans]NVD25563.1 hypothetical protein [Desulfuromonas acetoxidans]NVE17627.1 hypothetical protein [Desulfuromonas acetoxidans]
MAWQREKYQETLEGLSGFFEERLEQDPQGTLQQVEGELKALYIRLDQDWTGRGPVGDTVQTATIAALERVRARCLTRIVSR